MKKKLHTSLLPDKKCFYCKKMYFLIKDETSYKCVKCLKQTIVKSAKPNLIIKNLEYLRSQMLYEAKEKRIVDLGLIEKSISFAKSLKGDIKAVKKWNEYLKLLDEK